MDIKTLQIPRLTTAERDALIDIKVGTQIFNTTTGSLQTTADAISWDDALVTPVISNVDNLILNNGGKVSVTGASTTFEIENNSQGGGSNITVFPGETAFRKSINLQNNISMTFPFETNSIGSPVTALNALYVNNVTVPTASASTLLGTDADKVAVSTDLTGDVTTAGGVGTTLSTVNANVGTFGDTTNVSQVTVNGKGLVTSAADVPITFPTVSLQSAYTDGDGTITVSAAKPVEVIGISSADPAKIGLYTPVKAPSDTISSIDFDGNNASDARVGYGRILPTIEDPTTGDHNGKVELQASVLDSMQTFVTLSGAKSNVTIQKDLALTAASITYDGQVISAGYFPRTMSRVIANSVIVAGAPLKASTVAFRVEQITSSDPSSVQTIGYAIDAAGSIGDEIRISGSILERVTSDAITVVAAGDSLTPSFLTDGRVKVAEVTQQAFGVAAQDAAINTPLVCWIAQRTLPGPGVFMQTVNGPVVTATAVETEVLGTGVGTLKSPPGGLNALASFKFDISGNFSANNGDTLTMRLVSNFTTTPILLSSIIVDLETTTNEFFELEADFAVRTLGVAGVASVATSFDFTFNRNIGGEFVGQRAVDINDTTFDTTIVNEIGVTAQFSSANASNSIETVVANFSRTF